MFDIKPKAIFTFASIFTAAGAVIVINVIAGGTCFAIAFCLAIWGCYEQFWAKLKIKVGIDKCSWGDSVIKQNEPVSIVQVDFTLNVNKPPVKVTNLQLCIGNEVLESINPSRPILQEKNKGCHIAEYGLDTETIHAVPVDMRNEFHLCAVVDNKKWCVDNKKWCSKAFSINNP